MPAGISIQLRVLRLVEILHYVSYFKNNAHSNVYAVLFFRFYCNVSFNFNPLLATHGLTVNMYVEQQKGKYE